MKKKAALALLLACLSCTAYGAELSVDEIMGKMEEADKKITSIEFTFKQEVSYNITGEKQTSGGSVKFMKPDKISMSQDKPLQQEIVSNGSKVWIYTPKYGQVITDSWKKWIAGSFVPASIINFGKGFGDLKKRYKITWQGEEDGKYVLDLKPQGIDNIKMKFWVGRGDFIPVKLAIYGENVTITTEMLDKTLNPPFDKKTFTFTAPPGAETMELP